MGRLYMIPRGSKIFLDNGATVIFDHLDGMYSYCYLEDDREQILHLSAATPLKRVKGGYKIQ